VSDNNDTRFQFEIIKQLAESVRVQGEVMRDIQSTQISMLERLARIEEHKMHEAFGSLAARVDTLERIHDEERGAEGVRKAIMQYWPAIALLLLIIWTVGSALGFFHLPQPRG
jgi:hypothetical protein